MKDFQSVIPPHIDDSIDQLCNEIEELADLIASIANVAGDQPLELPYSCDDPFEIVH
jgi:hypothetical protein